MTYDEITVREAGWPQDDEYTPDIDGNPIIPCPECGEPWSDTKHIPGRLTREVKKLRNTLRDVARGMAPIWELTEEGNRLLDAIERAIEGRE